MSLAEKRIQKNVEENHLTTRRKEMNELTGGNVELTVDWNSYEKGDDWLQLNHQGWGRVVDAMKHISRDDLGKEALTEINTIHIRHVPASDKKLTLINGTFEIAGDWTGSLSGIFSVSDITSFLSDHL